MTYEKHSPLAAQIRLHALSVDATRGTRAQREQLRQDWEQLLSHATRAVAAFATSR